MLSDHDQLIIERIVNKVFERRVDPVEVKIDKVLKIATRSDSEHTITKNKVNHLEKRVKKIETKLKIKSPVSTSVLA
jgi:polyhydroxyalkanoate synthesis regulator phasin